MKFTRSVEVCYQRHDSAEFIQVSSLSPQVALPSPDSPLSMKYYQQQSVQQIEVEEVMASDSITKA